MSLAAAAEIFAGLGRTDQSDGKMLKKIRVLGISFGHNATACLMEDGKTVFCQSEERLNGIKNSSGFPFMTLGHIYDRLTPPHSVDMAVLYERTLSGYLGLKQNGFECAAGGQYLASALLEPNLKQRLLRTSWGWKLQKIRLARREKKNALRKEAEAYFAKALRLPSEKIRYLDHHVSHAHSAIANVRDWGRTLIFTLDAYGDGRCATVNLYDQGKLVTLCSTDDDHSLGNYYLTTTLLLGMKAPEDEHKVMGLAPYANPKDFSHLAERLHGLIRINSAGNWESIPNPENLLYVLERIYRSQRFDRIAGAIQSLTESLVTQWVEFWVRKTGCRNVAVAGGVFMNVKVSQKLAGIHSVEKLFVVPSAGDESCAIGCAAWGTLATSPSTPPQPLGDLYLGTEYDRAAISNALQKASAESRYSISEPPDIDREVAGLLAQNRIVARFSGRAEFGARALGNRSILANPGDLANMRRLNGAIKNRDYWMPFAPSILEEDLPRYVLNPKQIFAPYMSIAFDTVPAARGDIAAAIHPTDFTVRPQVVRETWNPGLHEIIRLFKAQTGIGAVLNTSFNLHGEPIVSSPLDAIRTVDQSGLTHLALGGYLLTKKIPGGLVTQ
jgi:carbamoyltransferase